MSYKATAWAYDLPLIGSQKFVLVALADMADEAASCYPGQERLSQMTGLSVRTVRRSLDSLEAQGLIRREPRYASNGNRTSDRYYLSTDVQVLPDILTSGHSDHRSSVQGLPDILSTTTGHSDRVTISRTTTEQPVTPLSPPTSEVALLPAPQATFDDFWAVWPRHEGRKPAETAWNKAIRRADPFHIVTVARAYADSPWRPAHQFIPHGSTWLNQERWNDPLPQPPEESRDRPNKDQQAYAILRMGAELEQARAPKAVTR